MQQLMSSSMPILSGVWEAVGTELALLALFCAGFLLFRQTAVQRVCFGNQKWSGKVKNVAGFASGSKSMAAGTVSAKQLEANWAAGRADLVLSSWQSLEYCTVGCLRAVVEALISVRKEADVVTTLHRILARHDSVCTSEAMAAALDSLPESRTDIAAGVRAAFSKAMTKASRRSSNPVIPSGQNLEEMRSKIYSCPSVCEALLRGHAASGDSRSVEVFEEVLQTGFQPSESLMTALISLCAECRHVQMAEHVLNYARTVQGRSSLALYSAMIKVYGQSRLFEKTCSLYESMQKEGVKPDTVVYGSIIKAAVESGRLELARQLFKESGNPDLLNCMSLIRAAGRERDVPKALELLGDLEAAPLPIDATAYNCVLEVCVACGNRAAAEGLLKRMEGKGQVDVVSYNTYLKILFAHGSNAEVKDILKAMRSRGLRPNAVTYNSLVKDSVMRQDLHGAWNHIEEMEKENVKPDAFTCSILMKGVKHTSCADDVDKIINLIHRAKVTPDEVLVNCLLDACVRLRSIPRLTQVLDQFKSTGVVPSLHACAMLIKAYGHARRLDKAWALWRELTVDRKVTPSDEVFASMVDACLANGDLENAVAVFREMKHAINDLSRGPMVFSQLVKVCVQRKQVKLAVELYQEMRDVSFTCTKVTYNSLIDALVRDGDMDGATSLFRDMGLNGVTPDLISYSTLIKGHCTRGDLEQGLQLLGLMQRRNIYPDAIVFNSILDGCAHKQMRTLTEQVLKDMENAGIAPSNFTLSILVKLYGRCNDLDTAFNVVEAFPEKYHFKLNAQVYTCLMSACIANNALPRALDVYSKMRKAGCPADAKMYHTLLNGCVRHGDLDAAGQLFEDALDKSPPTLDRETAENVLFMMVRRGRGTDLAQKLLEMCDQAGIRVADRVSDAVRRCEESRPRQRANTVRS